MIRLLAALAALALTVPVVATGSATFVPDDPLVPKQWYLDAIHAFDFWPDSEPVAAPVRVAVIDSGIDAGHPEFAGRIAASRSFVGGDDRRQAGARDVRRRHDRRRVRQRGGDRRDRLPGRSC